MIKDILLPERIGNHFLFTQTRIGLELTKASLITSTIHIAGSKAHITHFFQEAIVKRDNEENDQAIVTALQKLAEKTGTKTPLTLALANQLAIFKELTVPFLNFDKIQQILPFELEQQIPFAITDVTFDFIITKQDLATKQSTIFIGIVQKKDIAQIVNLLEKANLTVQRITIDLFALYNLYSQHPQYAQLPGGAAIVDLSAFNTTIAYINNHQLAAVRSLNYGFSTLAKNVAEKVQKTQTAVVDQLVRFGANNIQDEVLAQALNDELQAFGAQIQFALATCTSQVANAHPVKHIVLCTRTNNVNGFELALEHTLSIKVENFNPAPLLEKNISLKSNLSVIPATHLASLGAIMPWGIGQYFDLMRMYAPEQTQRTLVKQLIVAASLVVIFIGSLVGHYYTQRTQLRAQINRAKNSALTQLRNEFGITERNLTSAVESAQEKIDEFQRIWEGFSIKQRGIFLVYLNDLATVIDRDGIGLTIRRLAMDKSKRSVVIDGQVRDYQALKKFEEELGNSSILQLVNSPQEYKFVIKLIAKVHEGENS